MSVIWILIALLAGVKIGLWIALIFKGTRI